MHGHQDYPINWLSHKTKHRTSRAPRECAPIIYHVQDLCTVLSVSRRRPGTCQANTFSAFLRRWSRHLQRRATAVANVRTTTMDITHTEDARHHTPGRVWTAWRWGLAAAGTLWRSQAGGTRRVRRHRQSWRCRLPPRRRPGKSAMRRPWIRWRLRCPPAAALPPPRQADSRQVPAHCKQLVVRFQCYMEPVSDNVDVFCVL